VEQYRTEEEQVEVLKRWWEENGRSTLAAIIIALSAGFAWQTWKGWDQRQRENASDAYQAMIQVAAGTSAEERQQAEELAQSLRENHGGTTYAQFAALHLARLAVEDGDLAEAQAQLRWVLGKADKGSDTAQVAQLRLARVLAAAGEPDQGLSILEQAGEGAYQASYAMARGDILLQQGRESEARQAYTEARMHAAAYPGQVNLATLEQKLQSLTSLTPESLSGADLPFPQENPGRDAAAGVPAPESAAEDAGPAGEER
jgi:predicted negative regulator of RcsB-dependent stress response